MTNNIVFRIVAVIVLIVIVTGIGAYAYQVGLAQGTAGAAQLSAGETGKEFSYPVIPPYRPYPFGFGPFGWLVPVFLFLMFLWALRAIFGCMPHLYHGMYWAHPAWRGFHRTWKKEDWNQVVPPFFEEWHRKAHEGQTPSVTEDKEA